MVLFADTADLNELKELSEMGLIQGVTTNPSIISRAGSDISKTLLSICKQLPGFPVFAQVSELNPEKSIAQARQFAGIHPNIVVKIPVSNTGLKTIAILKKEGITVCATTILTSAEALFCALAGADYVAPYTNQIDSIGYDGFDTLRETAAMFKASGIQTKIIAAAIDKPKEIVDGVLAGADILTLSYRTILDVCDRPKPLTDYYTDCFMRDWVEAGCTIK